MSKYTHAGWTWGRMVGRDSRRLHTASCSAQQSLFAIFLLKYFSPSSTASPGLLAFFFIYDLFINALGMFMDCFVSFPYSTRESKPKAFVPEKRKKKYFIWMLFLNKQMVFSSSALVWDGSRIDFHSFPHFKGNDQELRHAHRALAKHDKSHELKVVLCTS